MTDFLTDQSGDLRIGNGDFVVGESADQEVEIIVCAHPGEMRFDPTLGTGISDYLSGPLDLARVRKVVSFQLKRDRFRRIQITLLADQKFNIEASR